MHYQAVVLQTNKRNLTVTRCQALKALFFSLVLSAVWQQNVWSHYSLIVADVVGDVMFWVEHSTDKYGLCGLIHLLLINRETRWPLPGQFMARHFNQLAWLHLIVALK